MIYALYELQHFLLTPARLSAEAMRTGCSHPWNPLSYTQIGRSVAAGAELFERVTKKFGKPDFGLEHTTIDGKSIEVHEEIIAEKPFCDLIHFKRDTKRKDPKVLIVAPMSGHFSTLLRGTVEALLPHHDVYITDWIDAKMVPLEDGIFDLDSYISYLHDFLDLLGPKVHLIAVCQPAVPVFAAVAAMESERYKNQPLSMTLMGGPIDPRVSKTQVTELAETRDLQWFEDSVVHKVPPIYPAAGRPVYPGFIQLGGFMSMNLDRHMHSHFKFYQHLIEGDGDSAALHRKFYDEYLSVMDIDAAFYLQTVESVFQRHDLPKGTMVWNNRKAKKKVPIRPQDIKKTALLTVEGEKDDISALGQTIAAHDMTTNLDKSKKFVHLQLGVGHYGIFNGRRWRQEIMPRIRTFIRQFDKGKSVIPPLDLQKIGTLKADRWDPEKHNLEAMQAYLKEVNHMKKTKAKD